MRKKEKSKKKYEERKEERKKEKKDELSFFAHLHVQRALPKSISAILVVGNKNYLENKLLKS